MTRAIEAFTGLVGLATALVLGIICYLSVMATTIQVARGTPNAGIAPLLIAVVAFLAAMFFAMPTARLKMLVRSFSFNGRLGMLLFFAVLAGVTIFFARLFTNFGAPVFFGALPETYLPMATAGFLVIFFLTFVLPGWAYVPLRRALAQEAAPAFSQMGGTPVVQTLRWYHQIARVVMIGVILPSLFLAFYALREAQFVESPDHVAFVVANAGTALMVSFPIFLLAAILVPPHKSVATRWGRAIARCSFLFCAVMATALVAANARIGVPAVHSLFADGEAGTLRVVLVERGQQTRTKACNRTATVLWEGREDETRQICEVPLEIWNTMSPGDTLILEGHRTQFGFRYDTVRRGDT